MTKAIGGPCSNVDIFSTCGMITRASVGLLRDSTGAYTWGFIFLAILALGCLAVNYFLFIKPAPPMRAATVTV